MRGILKDILATGLDMEISPPAELNPDCIEEEFKDYVLDRALERGWKRAHFRPAQTEAGWRTAVQGDGKGFPDLILLRERLVIAELKVKRNKPSEEQIDWIVRLGLAGIETYLWYPKDMPEILTVLAVQAGNDT